MPAHIRPLRLFEIITLIAALAIGLALARDPYRRMNPVMIRSWAPVLSSLYWATVAYPLIMPPTLAAACLGLGRLGWSPRRLWMRPGAVVACASTVVLGLCLVNRLPTYLEGTVYHIGPVYPWVEISQRVGCAALGALVVSLPRWRSGRWDVLDAISVALGALWAASPIAWVGFEFWNHWPAVRAWLAG